MSPAGNGRGGPEVEFFGRMAASISHEIKNKLAIVKEESGLITDLFAMAERGRPYDPARIKELAARIQVHADEIDAIVRRLNHFSHSVDEPRRTFDVSEALLLVGEIGRRVAAMSKVQLELVPAPAQAQITNDPFLIQHLLFIVLESAVAAAGPGGVVRAEVRDAADAVHVVFSGASSPPEPGAKSGGNFEDVLARSGASVTVTADPIGLAVILPKDLHRV